MSGRLAPGAGMIDAHVHVWDERRLAAYDWMTDRMASIRRPFGLDDLQPSFADHGVTGVVLVQTCASHDETRDFLALAGTSDRVAGVVGWVDLTDPGVADTIAELRDSSDGRHLVGIRHQVHDEPDAGWLLRDDVRRGLRTVQDAGLAYDLLVRARELPAALEVARRLPDLRLVLDHLAKPPVATGELEPWAERMEQLAELEHVSCKVSGLVTEAKWTQWSADDFRPYVSRVAEWFGEDRLLFGSDWPVCLLAASYGDVVRACEDALGAVSPSARQRIFHANAATVYGLERVATVPDAGNKLG